MAKKTDFGIPPESFNESRLDTHASTHKPTHNSTHGSTHKPTHSSTHIQEPVAKQKKKKRVQLLTFEDLVAEVDAYAKERGVPRVAVFETAVRKFLDEVKKG